MTTGIINNVWTKTVPTPRGRSAEADVTLCSLEGNTEGIFSFGFGKCPIEIGDEISFSAEFKFGEQQIDKKTLRVLSKGNSTSERRVVEASNAGSGGRAGRNGASSNTRVFPVPATHGDRSIIRQNALARAVELYKGSDTHESWKSQGLSTEELAACCIDLAYIFERYTSGDDLSDDKDS